MPSVAVLACFGFHRVAALAVAVAALVALSPARPSAQEQASRPASPQDPDATFRVEVSNVEVDVTVVDDRGNFVRGLGLDDFQLLEDGKPQTISAFGLVDVPVRASPERSDTPSRPIESDVRSNERASTGRVYVLVLDDLHTHALRSARVKQVARQFIEQYLAPGDLAAVVHTSGRSDGQELTTSRRLLVEALEKFSGRKLRSSVLARLEEYRRMRDSGQLTSSRADRRLYRVQDPQEAERAAQARRLLESLEGIGTLLDTVRGRRKAVVLISEGIDYDLEGGVAQTTSGLTTFTSPSASNVRQRMREAIASATRSNATIYAIDPRGLAGTGDEVIEMGAPPENPQLGLGPTALQDELRRSQDTLRVLAEETGGAAAVSSNDFSTIFDRLVRDTSTYYMLGYTSSNERRDGRFREIEVRVNRPGVNVRARKGYVAPSDGAPAPPQLVTADAEPIPALRDALNSPVPTPGLGLHLFAAPFRSTSDPSVLVGVEADGRRFTFDEKDGLYHDKLHLVLGAVNENGEFRAADRHTVEMQLKPETYEAVRTRGVRLLFRLELSPGRYQLRAAAYESGGDATGSVYYDLDVPEFGRQPLGMSGLVLTSTDATLTPTARSDARLAAVLPAPPTTVRQFETDERLSAYVEIYPKATERVAPIDLVTSVVAPDGRVVFRSADQLSREELREAREGYGWLTMVPLADVPPGRYVLRVQLRTGSDRDATSIREVPVVIRAPGSR